MYIGDKGKRVTISQIYRDTGFLEIYILFFQ